MKTNPNRAHIGRKKRQKNHIKNNGWEIGCIGSWLHLLLVLLLLQLLAGVVAASADEGECTA